MTRVPIEPILPRALQPGDSLAIVSPAGPTAEAATFDQGIALLESWGFRVRLMPNARHKDLYLAGTDDERLADLHQAFADPGIDGILCARGGYGCMRLLDRLDWRLIAANPKPLMGFSDITALLNPIFQRTGLVGFYAPMLTSNLAEGDAYTCDQWLAVMTGQAAYPYSVPNRDAYRCIRPGWAQGPLVGGNLSLIAALCGTPYQLDTRGAILFIEDWHEAYYSLDRQFRQLKLAGLLDGIAGLLLCDFSELDVPEGAPPTGDFLARLVADLNLNPAIPVGFGYSIGHGAHTATVPIGSTTVFDAGAGVLTLPESPLLRTASSSPAATRVSER